MNIVQYEDRAFIFPDDMDAFRKRYGVDVIFVDFEDGSLVGIGPNDKEWRSIPADEPHNLTVVTLRKDIND